jgi:hypothetical protein
MAEEVHSMSNLRFSTALGLALVLLLGTRTAICAAEKKFWESSPYRVHVQVAVAQEAGSPSDLPQRLASDLAERIDAALSPLWNHSLEPIPPAAGSAIWDLDATPPDVLAGSIPVCDKLLRLTVRTLPIGTELRCREFDTYIQRWGPIQRRMVIQRSFLGEACFQMLAQTFSPLAVVTPGPDDPGIVELRFKGSELARSAEADLVRRDDTFLPVLRRTDRLGDVRPGGIAPIPWTYLLALSRTEQGWQAQVESGVGRPFGIRRRGRVEQLAIAVRPGTQPTRVRFYARHDRGQGLPGYEVFHRRPGDPRSTLLTTTDRDGGVVLSPGESPLTTLLLRSDGQLLAKVPVVPGAEPLVEVPIADDPARLRAQAEIRVIREELIDLVAERAILMARIRAMLKEDRNDEARRLMGQLNDLPLQSTFLRRIDSAQRASRSDDDRVQQRIDAMFAETRSLLGRFLNVRAINELQTEVNAAP